MRRRVQNTEKQQEKKEKGPELVEKKNFEDILFHTHMVEGNNLMHSSHKNKTVEADIEMSEIMQPLSDQENSISLAKSGDLNNGHSIYFSEDDPDLDELPSHQIRKFHRLNDTSYGYSFLPPSWNNYLFPNEIPREIQLLRLENIAVPLCYLVVGLLQGSLHFFNSILRFLFCL